MPVSILALADTDHGAKHWATPATFRFGASGLLPGRCSMRLRGHGAVASGEPDPIDMKLTQEIIRRQARWRAMLPLTHDIRQIRRGHHRRLASPRDRRPPSPWRCSSAT